MSGTSGDGVDATLIRVGWREGDTPAVELIRHKHTPFLPALRDRILAAGEGRPLSAAELARLHADLGEAYAAAAVGVAQGDEPIVIGVHGQTVAHLPAERVTLQIGDAARVAMRAGTAVVADFRSADIAAGGQGAPLTPFADHVLFSHRAPCAILNLGGIANVTLLPSPDVRSVIAFDTGPGNMVIDALARAGGRPFDEDGAAALRGRVDERALAAALAHPYFSRPTPKSAGREEFGEPFARELLARVRDGGGSLDDAVATATALTARSAASALQVATPSGVRLREVLVAGGGAANLALMGALREALRPMPLLPTDDAGVPVAAREAMAFALLALYRMHGSVNTLPQVTGASRAVSAGAVHQP